MTSDEDNDGEARAPSAPIRHILFVTAAPADDEAASRGLSAAAQALRGQGYLVDRVVGAEPALARVGDGPPAAALVELRPPVGLELLGALLRLCPGLPVVVASAQATVDEAVRAMQQGADAYVPLGTGPELVRAVREAASRPGARRCAPAGRRSASFAAAGGLVGESPGIRAVLRQAALVAPTRTTVLLLGETGTGKERLAQAIHDASPRRHGPFVAVNCAALAESLLESELFGHEKGAFSGAHCRRHGRFELASGGTIFLDEIGEISPATQVKLLRVLQERQLERVGGNETISVDVRVIAATNRDLRQMVADHTFRADLYYRLHVMAIEIPPLRARRGDIPLLIEHLLPRVSAALGLPTPTVSAEAMDALTAHDWPGNVRELENVLERGAVLAQGGTVLAFDLPEGASLAPATALPAGGPLVPGASFREIEQHVILTTYEACGRSPQRTAEVLGISPRTVHYRLREYRGELGRRQPHRDLKRSTAVRASGTAPDS
jgi:DNA-binding NtrC family response regulator